MVAEELDFDVAGALDEAFDVDLGGAEGALGFARGVAEGGFEGTWAIDAAHALPAAAGPGCEEDGEAVRVGEGAEGLQGDGVKGAGDDGGAGGDGSAAGGGFWTQGADGGGGGAGEGGGGGTAGRGAGDGSAAGGGFGTHGADGGGGGSDEGDAGGLAGRGEIGVFGEEAVAGVDGVGAVAAGGLTYW